MDTMTASSAGISSCKRYRWWLYRELVSAGKARLIIWVMMNPSTADHSKNDPTINKVMSYSKSWGFTDLLVLNIYAIRSTQQANIKGRVGSRNDWWLSTIFSYASRHNIPVICAWGRNHKDRGDEVRELAKQSGIKLLCLEHATNREPKHPLYLRKTLRPTPL
jgi:hypothetical protein